MAKLKEWRIRAPFGARLVTRTDGSMGVQFSEGFEQQVLAGLKRSVQEIETALGPAAAPPAQAPIEVRVGGMAPPQVPPGAFSPFNITPPGITPGGVTAPTLPVDESGNFDPTRFRMAPSIPPGGMGGLAPLPQPPVAPPPPPPVMPTMAQPPTAIQQQSPLEIQGTNQLPSAVGVGESPEETLDPAMVATFGALPDTPDGKRPAPVAVEWKRGPDGEILTDAKGNRIAIVGGPLQVLPQPPIAPPPPAPVMRRLAREEIVKGIERLRQTLADLEHPHKEEPKEINGDIEP